MNYLHKALAISLIIGLMSCSNSKKEENYQPSLAETATLDSIKEALNQQRIAWNSGDIEGFMSYYKQSDSTAFFTSSGMEYGYERILRRYQKRYPGPNEMGELGFELVHIELLGNSNALVAGKWYLKRDSLEALNGIFTLLFEKDADNWKIIYDHTS